MKVTNKSKGLSRKESFFGIHFDFHAMEYCKQIGKYTTEEMIETIIQRVRPDYIQCDCRGHRGLASYPTKIGYTAPGLEKDGLRVWRDVTAKYGIPLYAHFTGVFDIEAVRKHPEWARIDEAGNHDLLMTSTFGDYNTELLIPLLKELCDDYNMDGAWIDGDMWAVKTDFNKKAIEAFKNETGITEIPVNAEDNHYFEYMEFCRESFRNYIKKYVDELHQYNPNFEITSSWAYTRRMPDPVEVDIAWISGDFWPSDSINSARLEARCIASQGKPWDLLAWGFYKNNRKINQSEQQNFVPPLIGGTKTAVQLKQEAAIVLSLGGGFQIYFRQNNDGSVNTWEMDVASEVAEFCRNYQSVCHKTKGFPQIGIFHSSEGYYRSIFKLLKNESGRKQPDTRLFNGQATVPMYGIMQALLESQHSVEILMSHNLKQRMSEYPLIVIPEWECIEKNLVEELIEYVNEGGNLLIIGCKAMQPFKEKLELNLTGEIREDEEYFLENEGFMAQIDTSCQPVVLKGDNIPFGNLFTQNNTQGQGVVAGSIIKSGKGKIGAIYFNFGEWYSNRKSFVIRDYLNSFVKKLFPDPIVEIKGSHFIDLVVNGKENKMNIHLINTAGYHSDEKVAVFDEIPPVGPLDITVKYGSKPNKVTLEPGGKPIDYSYKDKKINIVLPKLEIYNIIVVE